MAEWSRHQHLQRHSLSYWRLLMEKLEPSKSTINYKRYKLKASQDNEDDDDDDIHNASVKNVI